MINGDGGAVSIGPGTENVLFVPNECPMRLHDEDTVSPCTVTQECSSSATQSLMFDSHTYCTHWAKWTPELACAGKELTLTCGFLHGGELIERKEHFHVLGSDVS